MRHRALRLLQLVREDVDQLCADAEEILGVGRRNAARELRILAGLRRPRGERLLEHARDVAEAVRLQVPRLERVPERLVARLDLDEVLVGLDRLVLEARAFVQDGGALQEDDLLGPRPVRRGLGAEIGELLVVVDARELRVDALERSRVRRVRGEGALEVRRRPELVAEDLAEERRGPVEELRLQGREEGLQLPALGDRLVGERELRHAIVLHRRVVQLLPDALVELVLRQGHQHRVEDLLFVLELRVERGDTCAWIARRRDGGHERPGEPKSALRGPSRVPEIFGCKRPKFWAFGSALTPCPVLPKPRAPMQKPLLAISGTSSRSSQISARDLVALAKPRITLMVIITAAGGLFLPHRLPGVDSPSFATVLATLLGTSLIVSGANALNMYIEREVDRRMDRTKNRPLPAGRLSPKVALWFGVVLSAIAVPILAIGANPLTALLAVIANLLYVLAYTPLKQHSAYALHVGASVVLFSILFLWQIPHFVAIALFRKADYARAGLIVQPNVEGELASRHTIVRWIFALVATSLLAVPLGVAHHGYLVAATVLGALFFGWGCWGLKAGSGTKWAKSLFGISIVYLTLLFAALAINP